jgi:hypothetical protein
MADGEAVLGVNLAAGVAYLGLVSRAGVIIPDEPRKVEPASNVDEWTELHRFGERVLTEARARHAVAVVFVEPQKFNNWKYYDAHKRGSLQTAVGLALRPTSIRMISMAQMTVAAAFGCKGTKELHGKLPEILGLKPNDVVHWKDRSLAFAAALCHVREMSS